MPPLEPDIVTGVEPDPRSGRAIANEFRRWLEEGVQLRPVGAGKQTPQVFLESRYLPKHKVELFDATFFLTNFLFETGLNFLVAYVGLGANGARPRTLHPRIFYKDSSLVWRVASHMIRTEDDDWIGKGDVKWERSNGDEHLVSDEDSTNLPYELQAAFDRASRAKRPVRDEQAVALVLRNGPPSRLEPYADFTAPRRRADRETPLNGNRPVARITRRGDPASLRFAKGFEPDLAHGLLEVTAAASRLYGGAIRKVRVRSRNGKIQYQFVVSPTHVWLNPPQALSRELTTFGLRALHVRADDDVFLPGFEYHFVDHTLDPPELHTQIPTGYAGEPSEVDPERADASAWIEALPIVKEFRRRLLPRLPRPTQHSGPRKPRPNR